MSILTTLVQQLFRTVRQGNEQLIELRRDDLTLNAQAMRIERRETQAYEANSEAGGQVESLSVVMGDTDLDIQVGDRFNDSEGNVCEVIHVSPNRQVCTQAIARLIQ